jgi:hypothetical protein
LIHFDWRRAAITSRRAAIDYAKILKDLSDAHFPHARKIVLVQDNLDTHAKASLYEAFPPADARRLVERFEWRYTPEHGSWLNMAESELGVLACQCLDHRIPDSRRRAVRRPPARPPQQASDQGRLALHNCGCPHPAQAPLSSI